MKEKTLEFKSLKELAKSEVFNDKNVKSVETHFDKNKKKYISKVEYGRN